MSVTVTQNTISAQVLHLNKKPSTPQDLAEKMAALPLTEEQKSKRLEWLTLFGSFDFSTPSIKAANALAILWYDCLLPTAATADEELWDHLVNDLKLHLKVALPPNTDVDLFIDQFQKFAEEEETYRKMWESFLTTAEALYDLRDIEHKKYQELFTQLKERLRSYYEKVGVERDHLEERVEALTARVEQAFQTSRKLAGKEEKVASRLESARVAYRSSIDDCEALFRRLGKG